MKQLLSRSLHSTVQSGPFPTGKVRDFYFDDRTWNLRYLVCQPEAPVKSSPVLVPSPTFGELAGEPLFFPVTLGPGDLRRCLPPESDLPVSRQKEVESLGTVPHRQGDPHLRSFNEVRHYRVGSSRGFVGTVLDFVVDTVNWTILGLVVRSGTWFRQRSVLLKPERALRIDWEGATVWTDLHPAEWEAAPLFSLDGRPDQAV